MNTAVTKHQFEIQDGVYIHTPTQAEFEPSLSIPGSLLIYTGRIGSRLSSGEIFAYADVLSVMKSLWEEGRR